MPTTNKPSNIDKPRRKQYIAATELCDECCDQMRLSKNICHLEQGKLGRANIKIFIDLPDASTGELPSAQMYSC
jgi:hypothetical protein